MTSVVTVRMYDQYFEVKTAETAVVTLMDNISVRHLRVLTVERIYQSPLRIVDDSVNAETLSAESRVNKVIFGFAYLLWATLNYGEVECSDLIALFKVYLVLSLLLPAVDIPSGFMSEDMTYSCGIFDDLVCDLVSGATDYKSFSGGEHLTVLNTQHIPKSKNDSGADCCLAPSEDLLYEAQLRKLKHIIDKAKISSDQHVLEIGYSYTQVSAQQQALAMERIQDAGLQKRVTVHLMDYRAMPPSWKASFDSIISIEMIEQVDAEYLEEYRRVLDWALKPEGGVGVVQVITIPEARFFSNNVYNAPSEDFE
ncbi:hypothetical protein BDR05DRAFT_990570 [Suillus weaverae]|nr:hypothetical protein BDR05DRAFT_990570 [Suillus weaverae]